MTVREEDMQHGRAALPLLIERDFRPWRYRLSHRTLVLRSGYEMHADGEIDVVFINVLAMKLRDGYRFLRVTDGVDIPEAEEQADVPERHRARFRPLAIGDDRFSGFVVCSRVYLRTSTPDRVDLTRWA